jgi:pilus assembly protein CpaF
LNSSNAQPQGGSVAAAREIRSEFESDFHAAQHDVARVLFESISIDSLSIDYPPAPSDRDGFERKVSSAVSTVSPQVDRDTLVDLITSECVGLGPVEMYLDDPEVQDIYVNRFDQILIRRNGEMLVAQRAFSHPDFLSLAAQRLLGTRDENVGADEVRFGDGTRVHVVMPPLSVDGPALTIRKPPTEHPSLDDLVGRDALSSGMREFLERAVQSGRSILVAGPTSSGKSTLLGAVAGLIPEGTRVVTVEESSHLNLALNSVVRLESNPATNHDLRYLVRTAVAMHPERIIVDECRGGEAYEWVTSAASGTEGSMIATHGTSASDALGRLESLCLLGNPEISPRGLREQISRAVDFVVVVHRNGDNGFRVRQITEVQGVDLDAFRLNDVFYYRVEGSEEQFHPTGYIPLFYEDLRHSGIEVDFDIFRD